MDTNLITIGIVRNDNTKIKLSYPAKRVRSIVNGLARCGKGIDSIWYEDADGNMRPFFIFIQPKTNA
jgi:hypothetical protein